MKCKRKWGLPGCACPLGGGDRLGHLVFYSLYPRWQRVCTGRTSSVQEISRGEVCVLQKKMGFKFVFWGRTQLRALGLDAPRLEKSSRWLRGAAEKQEVGLLRDFGGRSERRAGAQPGSSTCTEGVLGRFAVSWSRFSSIPPSLPPGLTGQR